VEDLLAGIEQILGVVGGGFGGGAQDAAAGVIVIAGPQLVKGRVGRHLVIAAVEAEILFLRHLVVVDDWRSTPWVPSGLSTGASADESITLSMAAWSGRWLGVGLFM
jgi:hypothetical protein